ncbi:MAG: hypothetical protein RJA20_1756 [Bacteroidota bacterium]|jgi:CcmD family protein
MKFFKLLQFLTLILFLVVILQPLQAQGNRDFMRETGKIYVVTGVILIIFAGIVLYLVRLDKKLTKIEHQLKEGKNE